MIEQFEDLFGKVVFRVEEMLDIGMRQEAQQWQIFENHPMI